MKQLFQYLRLDKPIAGLLGIEIEAEGKGMNEVDSKFWMSENDGSLRGHYPDSKAEFVLKKPIKLEQVVPALEELKENLPDAKFDFSYRTSVHVHLNVQELTFPQIINVIYTYFLLEEPMMTYCGKGRKANRFCLRLSDAEGLLETINQMIKEGEGSHHMANDNIRYSAINLAALNKYGSIEFRGMRGNMDVDVIHTWTRAIVAIKEYAIQFQSPQEIQKQLEAEGPRSFVSKVFGEELAATFNYPRILKDMAKSYSISLDIPYVFERFKREAIPEQVLKGNIVFVQDHGHLTGMVNGIHPAGLQMVYADALYEYDGVRWNPKGPYRGAIPPKPVVNIDGGRRVRVNVPRA